MIYKKIRKIVVIICQSRIKVTKIKKNIIDNQKMIIIDDEIKSIMPYNNSDNVRMGKNKSMKNG